MPADTTPAGYAGDLSALVRDLASVLVDQVQAHRSEAGPPWRSKHLTAAQALARTDQYDQPTPEMLRFLSNLPPAQLVQAALEAVALRRRAMARGEWAPPPGHTLEGTALPAMAVGAPEAIPGLHDAVARNGRVPAVALPHRVDVGGSMVPVGAANLARQALPQNVPLPTTGAQIARGDVTPPGVGTI